VAETIRLLGEQAGKQQQLIDKSLGQRHGSIRRTMTAEFINSRLAAVNGREYQNCSKM